MLEAMQAVMDDPEQEESPPSLLSIVQYGVESGGPFQVTHRIPVFALIVAERAKVALELGGNREV
ncbi:MAG TPA: hypothetical protein VLF66_19950, partial [Thermoanaerobaculia bacterium]|nr:hypothetical protein [Thermoanaerobaculia bacterium]